MEENYNKIPCNIYEQIKVSTLPYVAEILSCNTEDIVILASYPKGHYNDWRYTDNVIKLFGYDKNAPIFQWRGLHYLSGISVDGLVLRSCRNLPKLKYVIGRFRSNDNQCTYMFAKKGEVFRIVRHSKRMEKLAKISEKTQICPILDSLFLNNIMENIFGFIKNEKQLEKWDIGLTRGLLLTGFPGNGKSMLCRYIIDLCNRKNISCGITSGVDIDKAYVNGNLHSLFCGFQVIFFDDIDISYFNRSNSDGDAKKACAILSAMDGLEREWNASVRIFTTNENTDKLDPAFLRPGRIDAAFKFENPTSKLRLAFLEQWPDEIKKHIVDKDRFVKITEGLSFAEIGAIKTQLVMNYLTSNKWDIEKIYNNIEPISSKIQTKKIPVGFYQEALSERTSTYLNKSHEQL